jgi:molybdopterin-containing oxidoreductase family iron-sulfur binding subunit
MTGREFWRSLDELSNRPEFRQWLHREFPENASELADGASRRTLLKLMAASFGLAGLTACTRPVEKILPAAKSAEGYVPGRPLYFATAMSLGGSVIGLLAESNEGRPTKIEGNPSHPFSRGVSNAFAQASVLSLYDPDRARAVLHRGRKSSWEEFAAFARKHFGQPGRLRFLSQAVTSPSLEAVRKHALDRFPGAKWIEWEPLNRDQEIEGAILAFGRPLRPVYRFDQADVVLSLDADFLGLDAPAATAIRDFTSRRRGDRMNRLYVVESQFSATGAMADHRRRMRASEMHALAVELAREIEKPSSASGWAAAAARDLKSSRGLVVVGPRQPAAVHALAHRVNYALGNHGVGYVEVRGFRPQLDQLKELASEPVDTLVILGGNPAYDLPADTSFPKAGIVIHLAAEENETAVLADWVLPEAHYLESWGDARTLDGTASIQQPLIEPLHGGRTAAEVVALISGYKDQRAYDIVRNHWSLDEPEWRKCLHDGIVPGTGLQPAEAAPLRTDRSSETAPVKGIEVVFYPSSSTWDGRFANNGWMQEAPDPMTKLTWDNAALLSPATARNIGVETGDVVVIKSGGGQAEMPVLVQPGHADDSISLALGYGRTRCGRVGENVGHNAYPLRTTAGLHFAAAEIRKTGRRYPLATTQEHHSMEGRDLVRIGAAGAKHHSKSLPLYREHVYDQGNQWGMAIDLSACVGCNACLVACQAENNIPIVGKEQVLRGREMHWIRMDRYYTGSEHDPQAVIQPVACQQCESAPCESVCPVAATSHSPEGLNDMAYNRCVGTRYCANNCPYKVRRFNFLDFHKGLAETEKMVFNPEVTVRMRGVMEKCTYCVQRIEESRIRARAEGRRTLRDGEVTPACAQACPAEAIVFGNINDPGSRVAALRKQERNYSLLEELNTKPRTTYLAKLTNPNPELSNG